jgi:hypothetical protein
LKLIVIAGQLALATGPCEILTVPAARSIAFSVPSALCSAAPCARCWVPSAVLPSEVALPSGALVAAHEQQSRERRGDKEQSGGFHVSFST